MKIYQLADKDLWEKINKDYQTKGGVYKVIACKDDKGGQRIPIGRLLGQDELGILYIGKANSFLDRVLDLKKSTLSGYKSSAHDFGKRYKANPNIAAKFSENILFLELYQSDSPEELESQLITQYAITFGEVPPLNAVG